MDRLEGRMDGTENRLDWVELKQIVLKNKVDGIAIDLASHRADTEVHREEWQVREE